MKRMVAGLVAAVGVAGWLMAAEADAPAEAADRYAAWAGEWALVSFGEGDGAEAVPDGVQVTFALKPNGEVSGRSGCNQYGGQALPADDPAEAIRFGPLFSTMMACPEPAMQTEQRFHVALAAVARGRLGEDGGLRLADADGRTLLVFRRKPAD